MTFVIAAIAGLRSSDSSWKLEVRSNATTTYAARWTGTGRVIPAHGHFLIAGSAYTQQPATDESLSTGITDANSLRLTHSGTVVDVLGRYADSCADLRVVVDGLSGVGLLDVRMASVPVDPADVSRSCDYGAVGPGTVTFGHVEGAFDIDTRVAGCSMALTVEVDGCSVTPSPDAFTMAQPVTERRLVATCAQVPPPPPPPPVIEEPTFTG